MPPVSKHFGLSHRVTRPATTSTPSAAPASKSSPSTPQDSVTLSPAARGELTASVSEEQEQAFLKANRGHGGAIPLNQQRPNRPATLTIHGINDSPDSMKALSEAAARRGDNVSTFAYDDQRDRLNNSSSDLAQTIRQMQQQNPGQPINLSAHSMGGRIATDALRQLQEQGNLKGKVNLQMINPMIGGLNSANSARWAPPGIDHMIAGVKPGKDMGTNSNFQKTLERTQLPRNVNTEIFVGERDDLVNQNSPHFQGVTDGLNARVTTLPGADHNSAIADVARRR